MKEEIFLTIRVFIVCMCVSICVAICGYMVFKYNVYELNSYKEDYEYYKSKYILLRQHYCVKENDKDRSEYCK